MPSPASACRSRIGASPRRDRADVRPAEPAPPPRDRALGVREGRGGLRPQLWLLCDPDASGARSDHARSTTSCARSTNSSAREIVLVAQDLASFGRDQGEGDKRIVPLVRAVAERVDWVRLALPLSVGPHRRADRRHARHRRAVLRPVAAARVDAADASHASMGRRRAVPRAHRVIRRAEPDADVPLELHRRLSRARPRPITTSCSPSSRPPGSTGAASSPTRRRTGTYAADLDGSVARDAGGRAAGRARASCRTASLRPNVTN